jgi:transposase
MVQAYSPDLRSRVIKAAAGGMSARQAAERFGVGISTAIVWVRRYRQSGEAVARRQGKPHGSRLDAHEGFILGLVAAGTKDISLAEIAERLAAERGLSVGITSIWTFLDRHGLTFKKRLPTRRSSSARTSSKPGRPGSTDSSTSTPRS